MQHYKYNLCRVKGHHWQSYHPLRKRSGLGTEVSWQCANCTTIAIEIMSRATGELIDRRYEYPDGYRDEVGLTRDDFRKALVHDMAAEAARPTTHRRR